MESKENSAKNTPLGNYQKILKNIFVKTNTKDMKTHPEILKLIFPEPIIIYKGINKYEKSEKIHIPKGATPKQQKKVISLEKFKEMMYEFNVKDRTYIRNEILKKENDLFSKNYKLLLKQKSKFSTGTYLDYQYLFDLANIYAQQGKKIPIMINKSEIFKSNPLILSGADLEKYFLYNLGNKNKSSSFLKRINAMVDKKLRGEVLSDQEIRRIETLKGKEKPKGYVPLNILIPKLKNDIFKTQATIDNLEKQYSKSTSNIKSNDKEDNKNNNNNNNNINTNESSIPTRKIRLKRSLSLANYNKFYNRIESTESTKAQVSKRFSVLNPNISLPFLEFSNQKYLNSAMTRSKSIQLLPLKIDKKNIFNFLGQNLLNNNSVRDILSSFNRVSNTLDNEKLHSYNSSNIINLNSSNKKIQRRSLNHIKLTDLLTPIRRNPLMSGFSNNSKKNYINSSENLLLTNIENSSGKNLNDVIDILKQKEQEEKIIYMNQAQRREEEYKKCENMYKSILAGKYQSKRSKSVLSNFLQRRGYKSIRILKQKDNVLNLSRIKNLAENRNLILEEYKLRNKENVKSSKTEEQELILEKNEKINNKLGINDFILKKIICEKDIDKDEYFQ